jgi:Putative transposase/Transposase zinc-binding domain
MPRSNLEVADILRAHGSEYRNRHPLSAEQSQVMRHLVQCRTAALGGHVEHCRTCRYVRIAYNSCRDRHCPKCQAVQRAVWLERRLERLLPVPYFHVVLTLPDLLHPLVLKNPRRLYALLFQAASATLLALARDPRRLGARIGFSMILHTWGQNLLLHPHLHAVVTGGGLSADGKRWIAGRSRFFLPVKVLGRLFRGKFLAGLQQLYQRGELQLHGSVAALAQPGCFQSLVRSLYRRDWIVYAKPPFGGAQQVFRYLGRYTHRVAISNQRLLHLQDGKVVFQYKDYAQGQKRKQMTLAAEEFLRRFLLHVLPKGFVRIRHYGLLASCQVSKSLARCRQLLGVPAAAAPASTPKTWIERVAAWLGRDPSACPHCHQPLQVFPFEPGRQPLIPTHSRTLPSLGKVDSS